MHLPPYMLLFPGIIVFVLTWFAWDMSSILKSGQRKKQLSIEGRWADLENHYKWILKSHRPFVWLHQRYLLPGTILTQYALFLYNRGRLDEALAQADLALQQIENKPRIFSSIHRSETFKTRCGNLQARALILTGMGRYADAREVADQFQRLNVSDDRANAALALLDFNCGHLDTALALAKATNVKDPQFDSMRVIMALVYCMKGEFEDAIQSLLYKPGDISKFYSPEGLKLVSEAPEGRKLIELQRKEIAGVFQPSRLIILAVVYITKGEFQNADHALDQAESLLGQEPVIQSSYCWQRARSFAAQGKMAEAETYLERMRVIRQQQPTRSMRWETDVAAGQSYWYLARYSDALVELTKAQQSELHPIEKHATAFWLARTHESVGNRSEAIRYYQIVVADSIPTWMRKQAAAILGRQDI